MSTASWPEMLQPHRSSRVHFMRQGRLHIVQAVLELSSSHANGQRGKSAVQKDRTNAETKSYAAEPGLYCQLFGTFATEPNTAKKADPELTPIGGGGGHAQGP